MTLSVIIVNYNVRHFLEQALLSVQRAMAGIDGEVWVVDNNSVDDSVAMVADKFPWAKLIANKENTGFAVANNQAMQLSSGKYILLLNPDTLVEEDTFRVCVDFMDVHPEAGALGVKMIDGAGNYLPESKRGFPTPWVSFCKTTGLHALFPKSEVFNGYYLGHLNPAYNHPVDVLAGAFMFMRKEALDVCGLLDEAFFMYGEDIDLSWRIKQAGYENYYIADTQIIHYKGESTKKGSINYVKTFYQAMIIFARKHFQGKGAAGFIFMLQMAIWLRAGLTLASNIFRKIWLPLADAALIFPGLLLIKNFWANYFYHDPNYFKMAMVYFNFPLYTMIWIGSLVLMGAYDDRYSLRRLIRAIALGTVVCAAVYGFLDLDYRPSRAVIVLGAIWSVVVLAAWRALLHYREFRNFHIGKERIKNLMLVGSETECQRAEALLMKAGVRKNIVQRTPITDRLDEMTRIFKVEEIIFCSKDVPSSFILSSMTRLGPHVAYKILPEAGMSIIGSHSKDEPGELYTVDIRYAIAQPAQRRSKRLFDLGICTILLISLPFWAILSGRRRQLATNWWPVLTGRKTWKGYTPHVANDRLPVLRPGAFTTTDPYGDLSLSEDMIAQINFLYARDWTEWKDVEVFW